MGVMERSWHKYRGRGRGRGGGKRDEYQVRETEAGTKIEGFVIYLFSLTRVRKRKQQ